MTFAINNYDSTNPEHYKLIDDYIFFKYYVKVLFDTCNKFFFTSTLNTLDIYKVIIKHQNSIEIKRFKKLYNNTLKNFYNFGFLDYSINSILCDLFYRGKSAVIILYSNVLKDKFSLNNNFENNLP